MGSRWTPDQVRGDGFLGALTERRGPWFVANLLGRVSPELTLADEHVALATQHVARQKELIGELELGGHPIGLALELLSAFEDTLASHIHHRDRLLAEAH